MCRPVCVCSYTYLRTPRNTDTYRNPIDTAIRAWVQSPRHIACSLRDMHATGGSHTQHTQTTNNTDRPNKAGGRNTQEGSRVTRTEPGNGSRDHHTRSGAACGGPQGRTAGGLGGLNLEAPKATDATASVGGHDGGGKELRPVWKVLGRSKRRARPASVYMWRVALGDRPPKRLTRKSTKVFRLTLIASSYTPFLWHVLTLDLSMTCIVICAQREGIESLPPSCQAIDHRLCTIAQ